MPHKQNVKKPNAHKHGAFSRITVLPGENPQQFDELYSDLVEEWAPEGATEQDAVLSIAACIWRKRRVQHFLTMKLVDNAMDPKHASYIEAASGVELFASLMEADPEAFEQHASKTLQVRAIEYLKREVPRSKFESAWDWVEAMINALNSLPKEFVLKDVGTETLVELHKSAATVTGDVFRQELALDERLDAMIDRAIKRLINAKSMKQVLFPKRIE